MIAQNAIPMTLSIHRIEGHCVSGEEDRPTDAELLDAVRNGDKEAYRKLFRRFAAEIVAVCHRILNDRDEAEDVATEVFWEMWRRSDRYDPARATPRGYLVMMARCRAIDRLRSRARRQRIERPCGDAISRVARAASDPLQSIWASERKRLICQALSELAHAQRSALELAFFEGLSHREVAEKLSLPLGTVKTHIRKGLSKLQYLLRTVREVNET